jgi:hypothetical protein
VLSTRLADGADRSDRGWDASSAHAGAEPHPDGQLLAQQTAPVPQRYISGGQGVPVDQRFIQQMASPETPPVARFRIDNRPVAVHRFDCGNEPSKIGGKLPKDWSGVADHPPEVPENLIAVLLTMRLCFNQQMLIRSGKAFTNIRFTKSEEDMVNRIVGESRAKRKKKHSSA